MLAASSVRRLPRAFAQHAAVALYSSSLPKAEGAEAASVSSGCEQTYSNHDLAMMNLALLMKADAFQASKALAGALSPAQRVVLAATLRDLQMKPGQMDEAYMDELFKAASAGSSDGEISK
jgi:hypothetical protein